VLLEITARYTEPHRVYHTVEHPARMLQEAANRGIPLTDTQIWAIWGHDLVYEPGASDNERRSGELMVEMLDRAGHHPDKGRMVEQIILDTKDHVPHVHLSELVIDLDLLGFADLETSLRNMRMVREEFTRALKLTHEQWVTGRRDFLQGMLERDPFFVSAPFRNLSSAARDNIGYELQRFLT